MPQLHVRGRQVLSAERAAVRLRQRDAPLQPLRLPRRLTCSVLVMAGEDRRPTTSLAFQPGSRRTRSSGGRIPDAELGAVSSQALAAAEFARRWFSGEAPDG